MKDIISKKRIEKEFEKAYAHLLVFLTGIFLLVYKHPSFNIVYKLFVVFISSFLLLVFTKGTLNNLKVLLFKLI